MLRLSGLRDDPSLLDPLKGVDFLVPIAEGEEVIVRKLNGDQDRPAATIVFMHETIAMMKAERAEQVEKLRAVLGNDFELLPLKRKPESLWEHVTLGRASTADITVADPAVSSVHAHFALDVDGHPVSVQDVGSSNGTFINREPLQPHTMVKLRSGDCVRFGQSIFYYIAQSTVRELL